jgi:RHS repeat-associated protein
MAACLPLSDVPLGPAVMADDPCAAACGSADPTGPRKYYRARYYDPKLGRFISEDPIGFDGGENFYRYVEGSPVNRTDPMGLASSDGCCKQDYWTCVAKCIEHWDPLTQFSKFVFTGAGGTYPMSTAGKMAGGKARTTIPSTFVHAARRAGARVPGGAARFMRGIGDFFSPFWIAYGDMLFVIEVHCVAACAGYACYYE